jgi:hypothetical protein
MKKIQRKKLFPFALLILTVMPFHSSTYAQGVRTNNKSRPKIVNIVNFIRLLEPRDKSVTEDVLYKTVVSQVALMKKYKLGGTFLLQYDALMDPRYQQLLKGLPRDSFEIGAWWEIPQPLVEKAGLKWRGLYPWDWHANVGFTTGYNPAEREKQADVYMNDFKKIFGYYPKSVACWFIDAHTLNYLYQKYHIEASANCKDQYGTDGYTLWGGYWNQAYYPSKVNAYMPAQHAVNQIPVPIFRMLGSDPIRQYESGLGTNGQGVHTLEPVYENAGGDSTWVNWYFKEFVNGESMEYAYVQAGQENSFTWDAMKKGLELQMPLFARLRDDHKIQVETLAKTGAWFKQHYTLTPATSVTVNNDIRGGDKKTVWYDSRFYRINFLWENNTLQVRDIHLFNEKFPGVYEKAPATANDCKFFTLPLVDGFVWSDQHQLASLNFKVMAGGKEIALKGGDPVITSPRKGTLHIAWPLISIEGTLLIDLDESGIRLTLKGDKGTDWFMDLATADKVKLPFTKISRSKIDCNFQGFHYAVEASRGAFVSLDAGHGFKIYPENNQVILNLAQ